MPQFFFHTAAGEVDDDDIGIDLPDCIKARCEAISFVGDLLSDEPQLLACNREFHLDVLDDARQLLFTITATIVEAPAAGCAAG